jgi:phosphohistidine phosphatase
VITLAIARHADAEWGAPSLSDHDRPLSVRGRRDAAHLAALLQELNFAPERLISSTALRARETAAAVADALDITHEQDHRLYGAGPGTLLEVAIEAGAGSILLVAHDPGLTALAHALVEEITAMPTAGIARFTWDASSWERALTQDPQSWTFDAPR